MSSFATRIVNRGDGAVHHRVQVFAGPDPAHRALAGELTMRTDELNAFLASVPFIELLPTVARTETPTDLRTAALAAVKAWELLQETEPGEPEPGTPEWDRWRSQARVPAETRYMQAAAVLREALP